LQVPSFGLDWFNVNQVLGVTEPVLDHVTIKEKHGLLVMAVILWQYGALPDFSHKQSRKTESFSFVALGLQYFS
jgi:hypothetical protein